MSVSQLARRKRALLARRNGTSQIAGVIQSVEHDKTTNDSLFKDDNSDEEKPTITATRIALVASKDDVNLDSKEQYAPDSPKKTSSAINHASDVVSEARNNIARKGSQIARLLQRRRNSDALMTAEPSPHHRDDALFRAQLQQCADNATLSAYHSKPVEGFGESMLRAMGWTGPVDLTSPDDDLVPRPDRLGLGAKLTNGAPPPPSRKRRRISVVPLKDMSHPAQPVDGVVASSSVPTEHNVVDSTGTVTKRHLNKLSKHDKAAASEDSALSSPKR